MQSRKPLLLSNGSCLLRGKREVFTWEPCTASDLNRKKTNTEQAGVMNQASFHQTSTLQWALLSPYYRCENTESETLSNLFKVSTRSTEEIWNPGPSDSKTGFLTALSIRSLSLLEFIKVPLVQDVSPSQISHHRHCHFEFLSLDWFPRALMRDLKKNNFFKCPCLFVALKLVCI